MKVVLNYFKPTGKWNLSGTYTTEKKHLNQIWEEVRGMLAFGLLPGLTKNHSANYIVHVDVPAHKNNHPHLIVL